MNLFRRIEYVWIIERARAEWKASIRVPHITEKLFSSIEWEINGIGWVLWCLGTAQLTFLSPSVWMKSLKYSQWKCSIMNEWERRLEVAKRWKTRFDGNCEKRVWRNWMKSFYRSIWHWNSTRLHIRMSELIFQIRRQCGRAYTFFSWPRQRSKQQRNMIWQVFFSSFRVRRFLYHPKCN